MDNNNPSPDTNTGNLVQLPPYNPTNPRIWFDEVESIFAVRRINDEYRLCQQVMDALPQEVADVVKNVKKVQPMHPYLTLKRTVLSHVERPIAKALLDIKLADKSPSQLLREMRGLIMPIYFDEVDLKCIWLSKMPENMQQLLRPMICMSTDDLVTLADEMMKLCHVGGITTSSAPSSSDEDRLTQMSSRIEELANRLDSLEALRNSESKPETTSTSCNEKICWYHKKYRARAKNCVKPCSFKNQ